MDWAMRSRASDSELHNLGLDHSVDDVVVWHFPIISRC